MKPNLQFAILTNRELGAYHNPDATIDRRLMNYKAAAAYAAAIIKNPDNWQRTASGRVRWNDSAYLNILNRHHYPVAQASKHGNLQYDTVINKSDEFAPVQYILQAIANARKEVIASA